MLKLQNRYDEKLCIVKITRKPYCEFLFVRPCKAVVSPGCQQDSKIIVGERFANYVGIITTKQILTEAYVEARVSCRVKYHDELIVSVYNIKFLTN